MLIKYSVKLKLEEILKNEKDIMNFMSDISKNSNVSLGIWHNGIDTKTVNKFVKKYENLISSVNDDKVDNYFIISEEDFGNKFIPWKFKYIGDLMDGLNKYKNVLDTVSRIGTYKEKKFR